MKFLLTVLTIATLFTFPKPGYTQILDLGSLEHFTCYTGDGAVTNSGTSIFTGDIGSNLGIISGFGLPTMMTGSIYNADAVTAQARIDLLNVYIHLNDLPATNTHTPAFGGNETITPGVYAIPDAGSIDGTLILDGQGDPNAAFVIKFGGAMTVGAGSAVILVNGALPCNVFWIAEGAISMGATVTMKGTLIAHPGAISMDTGGDLEGRMISLAGAITFGPGIAAKPACLSTIPITCISSCTNTMLGSAAAFVLFSSIGAVANTGVSGIIGNIGSDFGAVSGWDGSVVVGNIYNADTTTARAKTDLQAAYTQLYNMTATSTSHTPAFGSGETLTPGVYAIAAAGSLAGDIILDGGGDPNSAFVFKFGAAFTVGAKSRVILTNGARYCNIFWIAEGAISIAALAVMKGNFIANNGATDMGENGFLEGRLFSTAGAVGFNTGTGYIAYSLCSPVILPIELTSFTASCENRQASIQWSTASERNNNFFSVERSIGGNNWQTVGTVKGAGSSTMPHQYRFTDNLPSLAADYFYRLKQTDIDNHSTYGHIAILKNCRVAHAESLSVFPNPSSGKFNLLLSTDPAQVISTEIFDDKGGRVYQSGTFRASLDLTGIAAGIYLVRIATRSTIITGKLVVKK